MVSNGILSSEEYNSIIEKKSMGETEEQAVINHFSSSQEKLKKVADVLNVGTVALLELGKIPKDVLESVPRGSINDLYAVFQTCRSPSAHP